MGDQLDFKEEMTNMEILKNSRYFCVEMELLSGRNLVAMDKGGTSDPYVVVQQDEIILHRSKEVKKSLNPDWNDSFKIYIEDPFTPLLLKVFDKDLVGKDDFMGQTELSLTSGEIDRQNEFCLKLSPEEDEILLRKLRKKGTLGEVSVKLRVKPLTTQEFNEILRTQRDAVTTKKPTLTGLVHVLLVQARGVMAMDGGISSDPYCKVVLGKEKIKSKVIHNTLNPKWRESMDLYWYSELDDYLNIFLFDQDIGLEDDPLGRVRIDLRDLRREVSHNLWLPIENGEGQLNVIVTITATHNEDSPSLLSNWDCNKDFMDFQTEAFKLSNTFYMVKDVGRLVVKVIKAEGLNAADVGGTSDPFAVLELVNDRVQTHTVRKSLEPVWKRIFTFNVQDIHDVLEVSIYDEDQGHKYDFLGKVMIPLLTVETGRKKWFYLKDKTMRKRAKGKNPRILLELVLFWNPIRASLRTFNPKQMKYEDKSDTEFKFQTFNKNVARVRNATAGFDPDLVVREITSILNWENKLKSSLSFVAFLLGVWFFEPWLITFGLLIPFFQNMILMWTTGRTGIGINGSDDEDEKESEDTSKHDDEDTEKKSLKKRMKEMQDVALSIQKFLGFLAHVLESVKNVFNFSVPFLSWLAFLVLSLVTVVLYFVPLRVLIMLWGINKFTKKLIRPWAVNNNELVDFISRVPDSEELKDFEEFPPDTGLDKKTLARMKKIAAKDNDII